MNDLEHLIICLLIPIVYVVTYIAGKYDILRVVIYALEEKMEEIEREKRRNDEEKSCATCQWDDTDPNEVGCPCWNCKGDYSEYKRTMSPKAFELMMKVLEDMDELGE